MKPIDKALELVSEYRDLTDECHCLEYTCVCFTMCDFKAKQCALIAVNEIIKNEKNYYGNRQVDYWQEVKQEIDKL